MRNLESQDKEGERIRETHRFAGGLLRMAVRTIFAPDKELAVQIKTALDTAAANDRIIGDRRGWATSRDLGNGRVEGIRCLGKLLASRPDSSTSLVDGLPQTSHTVPHCIVCLRGKRLSVDERVWGSWML